MTQFTRNRTMLLKTHSPRVTWEVELAGLWSLVDVSEQTGRHLMLAENCNYGRNELAMLKMAHEGVFGDVTNGHGGYLHDLRALLPRPPEWSGQHRLT